MGRAFGGTGRVVSFSPPSTDGGGGGTSAEGRGAGVVTLMPPFWFDVGGRGLVGWCPSFVFGFGRFAAFFGFAGNDGRFGKSPEHFMPGEVYRQGEIIILK